MCLRSKKTDPVTVEEIVQRLLSGQMKLAGMDLTTKINCEAALQAMTQRPTLVLELKLETAGVKKLLAKWVNRDYQNFLKIPTSLYFNDIATTYLYEKVNATIRGRKSDGKLASIKSFDQKTLFVFNHSTYAGEELTYFDEDIQMPTKIACSITAKFKVVNALQFMEELDIAVGLLSADFVTDYFDAKIQSYFRQSFAKQIVNQKVGCYHLPEYLETISAEVRESFFANTDVGLQLLSLNVNNMQIPNNMNDLLEEQYYVTRKKEAQFLIEQKESELALKNYERKAEIHEKYKAFEPSLTEAEKDFALKRYLMKNGVYKEEKSNFVRKPLEQKKKSVVQESKVRFLSKPVAPDAPQKKKFGIVVAAVFAALCVLCWLIAAFDTATGLILFGLTLIACGIFVGINWKRLKEERAFNKALKQGTLTKMEDYAADVAEFDATNGETPNFDSLVDFDATKEGDQA